MADSMFASLLNMLDSHVIGEVSHALGQPEQSVSRGLESSIAAVLGSLASKSNDTTALQRIVDLFPSTAGPVSVPQMASSIADPQSPLMATGRRLLPALFGTGENAVTSSISRASNLSPGAITTLLTMAGPMVLGFITKRIREGGMTMSSLASTLQRESGTIRSAVPAGLEEAFWPGTTAQARATSPVIAQTVQRERSSSNWILPAIAACALALGLIYLLPHARRPVINQAYVPPRGEASRVATPVKVACTFPSNINLPENGVAHRLVGLLENPDTRSVGVAWLTTNQMSFPTGSSRLQSSESRSQIDDVATVLKNCPNAHLTVAGYTDNTGTPDANLQLSRDRARMVVAQLVNDGVSADRLTAEGHGEQDPVADNGTVDGRAQNRRVAILVTRN
jgi:OmpA-OmpF porin, OOP family